MENSSQTRNTSIPSFFQNSCTGRGVENHREKEIASRGTMVQQHRPVVGGITCCVPECFINSLRNPELSCYVIPNGSSKEKQEVRKRWLHLISRKSFHPGPGHRVCSEHFVGGKDLHEQRAHSGPKE